MNVEILKHEKNEIEVQLDNATVAELVRNYLNAQGAEFSAWRREHPTQPVLLRVQSSGKTVKKEISEAISAIKKDLNSILNSLKK